MQWLFLFKKFKQCNICTQYLYHSMYAIHNEDSFQVKKMFIFLPDTSMSLHEGITHASQD